jgi:hypothetical protein
VNGRAVLINGVTTPMMSVAQAGSETTSLLRRYQRKVQKDVFAVLELLDIQPTFVRIRWVRKAFERLMKMERAKRRRGRPTGTYKINPVIVVGFVKALRDSGKAKNDHQAVVLLRRRGIFRYDQALHAVRAAKQELRLRPLWIPSTREALVSSVEAAELLRRAITPRVGQTLYYQPAPDGVLRLFKISTEDGQDRPDPMGVSWEGSDRE